MTRASRIRRVLVTGAAGFVGRHSMDSLLEKGFQVTAIDNFMNSSPKDAAPYKKHCRWITGDIRNKRDVKRAMQGVDAVLHLAAIRSVAKSVEDPMLNHDVNATGTLTLLDAAASANVKHFIFTSTSAVYGAALAQFQKEEGPFKPMSPYGMAKFLAEQYARHYYKTLKLPTTSVRIFNVYGPGQNPESKYSLVVPGVLSKILKKERPVIDGTGEQTRDFVYIDDIVKAFFKIMGNPKAYGKVYNLGSGRSYSIKFIVNELLDITGSPLKPVFGPRRPGDPDRTCASIKKIASELGWKPETSLRQGLKETVQWYQGHKKLT
jgi:UDP-glucose 4-epimerase